MHIPRLRAALAAAALLVGLSVTAAPVPAGPTDEQLKETALKLNAVGDLQTALKLISDQLKDKPTAKRLVKVAAKMHKDAPEKEPPFKFNAAFALARLGRALGEYDAAETLYGFCLDNATALKSGNKAAMVTEDLIELYTAQKKYQSVEKLATKFLEESAERGGKEDVETAIRNMLMMEKLANAKAKTGDVDGALKVANSLTQQPPPFGPYFLLARADVLREAGKFERAISALEDFLEKADEAAPFIKALRSRDGDDDPMPAFKRRVKYMMSGLYIDAENVDKSAEVLRELIKEEPDNPTYYNDLGFVLADHGRKLDESEQLVRKALDLDAKLRKKLLAEDKIDKETAAKESSAYLDSLGWVLFKKGKFAEALPYLEKATKDPDEGNHIEIWDHLADCLVALGQKQKAVEVWQKALTFEDISKRDLDRRKKVTQKLNRLKAELSK
jgi:tetratricopeptide (TPR) repeat protein